MRSKKSYAAGVIILLSLISSTLQATKIRDTDNVIILIRTGCYGTCPVYSITVFDDGRYIFTGGKFVKSKGVTRGKYKTNPFKKALALLGSARFDEFRSDYPRKKSKYCKELWTDNPSVAIETQINKKIKMVHHYRGCRGFAREKELIQLEMDLDKVFETKNWIKGQE